MTEKTNRKNLTEKNNWQSVYVRQNERLSRQYKFERKHNWKWKLTKQKTIESANLLENNQFKFDIGQKNEVSKKWSLREQLLSK